MTTCHLNYQSVASLLGEASSSGLLHEAKSVSGFSGNCLLGALQRVARHQVEIGEGDYLEVGVFQGLTLISVASVLASGTAYGIDNFAYFDRDRVNETLVNQRIVANGLDNVSLINMDYEDALESLSAHIGERRIGTYLVDGPHDYRSQLVCLQLAKPYLSAHAVIFVDDSNYPHVRQANRDFLIANPEFKLIFEAYTDCHPANMTADQEAAARKGWWNGVNIMVRDPENALPAIYPETIRDRSLYENEHVVHAARYGSIAPEAVFFVQSISSLRLVNAAKQLARMVSKIWKLRGAGGRQFAMNTRSDKLPKSRFNPGAQ